MPSLSAEPAQERPPMLDDADLDLVIAALGGHEHVTVNNVKELCACYEVALDLPPTEQLYRSSSSLLAALRQAQQERVNVVTQMPSRASGQMLPVKVNPHDMVLTPSQLSHVLSLVGSPGIPQGQAAADAKAPSFKTPSSANHHTLASVIQQHVSSHKLMHHPTRDTSSPAALPRPEPSPQAQGWPLASMPSFAAAASLGALGGGALRAPGLGHAWQPANGGGGGGGGNAAGGGGGMRGSSGANSTNGSSNHGMHGSNGINGMHGNNGIHGINGINGSNGNNSMNDSHGINGMHGSNGIHGINGSNGNNSMNDSHGINGMHGSNGIHGINGSNGNNSMNDNHGINGMHGNNGNNSMNGSHGINGSNGNSAANGINGSNGTNNTNSGNKSMNGSNGIHGIDGNVVINGSSGNTSIHGSINGNRVINANNARNGPAGNDSSSGTLGRTEPAGSGGKRGFPLGCSPASREGADGRQAGLAAGAPALGELRGRPRPATASSLPRPRGPPRPEEPACGGGGGVGRPPRAADPRSHSARCRRVVVGAWPAFATNRVLAAKRQRVEALYDHLPNSALFASWTRTGPVRDARATVRVKSKCSTLPNALARRI
ncbi:Collagen-like protein 2 [Diplonema papillatum]|nr:Collagen-like protein 2 [Diplonema papillatum]